MLHRANYRLFLAAIIIISSASIIGCSGGSPQGIIDTSESPLEAALDIPSFGNPGHQCWGFFEFGIDLANEKVELVPLREGSDHLNVLGFLEPPPLTWLDLDWDSLVIDLENNYLEVIVNMTHPFPGMPEFTGFDVRGILITDGDSALNDDSEVFAAYGEPRLMNPDGLTRWWNPVEFLGGWLFGYKSGLLGTPGGAGVFSSTLNGYKYFCDGLTATAEMGEFNLASRGNFPSGVTLSRMYKIDFGKNPSDFLRFNYAVDASWEFPSISPPAVPDDFPIEANSPEPFWVDVDVITNNLYFLESTQKGGGQLELKITVHDWQDGESIGEVWLDNPALFTQMVPCALLPPSDPNIREFYVNTTATKNISSSEPQDVIIKVFSNEGSYQQDGLVPFFGPPGASLAAYQRIALEPGDIPVFEMVLDMTTELPDPLPFTLAKDFAVIGSPAKAGVYYFGQNFKMYRYPLDYSAGGELYNTFEGFLMFLPSQLWGYPINLARLDMTQQGEFVMNSDSTLDAYLPPYLVRDFAFQFDSLNDPYGREPTQAISPGLSTGIMKVVDVSATINFNGTDCVFWLHKDDEQEPSFPAAGVTAPLLYYRYPYGPDIILGNIGGITGNPYPEGTGPGKVVTTNLKALAITGVPFSATPGQCDITCAFLETGTNEIEVFGIGTTDPLGGTKQYLDTITDFQGSPVDIEVFPSLEGGYDPDLDWIAVLEQGLADETLLEIFDLEGKHIATSETLAGTPVSVDVDPYNFKVHIWFYDSSLPSKPISAAVFKLE